MMAFEVAGELKEWCIHLLLTGVIRIMTVSSHKLALQLQTP
jgi:hypothetical protein